MNYVAGVDIHHVVSLEITRSEHSANEQTPAFAVETVKITRENGDIIEIRLFKGA